MKRIRNYLIIQNWEKIFIFPVLDDKIILTLTEGLTVSNVTVNEKLRVSKKNSLVEVNLLKTKRKLSLRAQKVVLSLIAQISPNDKDFKDYTLTIKELVDLTSIKHQNLYKEIDDICESLLTSIIYLKEPRDPKGHITTTWCAHASYMPSLGVVEFSFSPKLKPYLLQINGGHTSYLLRQVIHLRSTYSITFYELLRQFLSLKRVRSGETTAYRKIKIDALKEHLGISPDQYERYRDFKRYIVEKAQQELEEKTDLSFSFTPIKNGRKIEMLGLAIRHNKKFEEEAEISGTLVPEFVDQQLFEKIIATIPDISEAEAQLISSYQDKDLVNESLTNFMTAVNNNLIKGKSQADYFKGIMAKKRVSETQGENKKRKTTEELINDIDWMKVFEEEE